ncbi:hypothetical protein BGZ93_008781 [Podila epicladia]|nr:hypothetical protein BGZ92_000026 [Podila epicladia]KAG0099194.1 hypothetical protein BGZ93_008781 [Podila epicladia]
MYKSLALLATLCSAALAADYRLELHHNTDSNKWVSLFTQTGTRTCFCTKNVQTGWIKGNNGGDIKLFSSNDCTGNFQTLGTNERVNNAQWVNSVSFGKSGISSVGPSRDPSGAVYCPNWY